MKYLLVWFTFLHLLDVLISRFYHFKQKKVRKVLKLISLDACQTGVETSPSSLRFASYFAGDLARFRGSVWGLYFCSSLLLSSSLLFRPPLLQTLSRQSVLPFIRTETQARLSGTTMQSWQGVIAEGRDCAGIMKMIIWVGNLFSLNRTLSPSLDDGWKFATYYSDRWAFIALVQIRVAISNHLHGADFSALPVSPAQKKLLFFHCFYFYFTSIFCFLIINIAFYICKSYCPFLKNHLPDRTEEPLDVCGYLILWRAELELCWLKSCSDATNTGPRDYKLSRSCRCFSLGLHSLCWTHY